MKQVVKTGVTYILNRNKGIFMFRLLFLVLVIFLSSCVYILDIQQGNILDQKDIDKLRPDLTKNQVVFVLGNPVVNDSFTDDEWIYLYTSNSKNKLVGRDKKLVLRFADEKLVSAEGHFKIPESLKPLSDSLTDKK